MGRSKHTLPSDSVTYCRHANNGSGVEQYAPPGPKEPASFHCRGKPVDLCLFDRARTIGVCVECQCCITMLTACDESRAPLGVTLQQLFPAEVFTAEQLARESQFFLCRACRTKANCVVMSVSEAKTHLLHKLRLTAAEFKRPTVTASYVCAQIVKLILTEIKLLKTPVGDASLTELLKKTFGCWSQLIQKLSYASLERLIEAATAKPKADSGTGFHVILSWNHFLLAFK